MYVFCFALLIHFSFQNPLFDSAKSIPAGFSSVLIGNKNHQSLIFEVNFGFKKHQGFWKNIWNTWMDIGIAAVDLTEQKIYVSGPVDPNAKSRPLNCFSRESNFVSGCEIVDGTQKKASYLGHEFTFVDATLPLKFTERELPPLQSILPILYLVSGPTSRLPPINIGFAPNGLVLNYMAQLENSAVSFVLKPPKFVDFMDSVPQAGYWSLNPRIHETWPIATLKVPKESAFWTLSGKIDVPEIGYKNEEAVFCFESRGSNVIALPFDRNFCEAAISKICGGQKSCKWWSAEHSKAPVLTLHLGDQQLLVTSREYTSVNPSNFVVCNVGTVDETTLCPRGSVVMPLEFLNAFNVAFTVGPDRSASVTLLRYFYVPDERWLWVCGLTGLFAAALFAHFAARAGSPLEKIQKQPSLFMGLLLCADLCVVGSQFFFGGTNFAWVSYVYYVGLSTAIACLSCLRIFWNGECPTCFSAVCTVATSVLAYFIIEPESRTYLVTTTYSNGHTTTSEQTEGNGICVLACIGLGLILFTLILYFGLTFFVIGRVYVLFRDFRASVLLKKYPKDREEPNFLDFVQLYSKVNLAAIFLPSLAGYVITAIQRPEAFELERLRGWLSPLILAAYLSVYGWTCVKARKDTDAAYFNRLF